MAGGEAVAILVLIFLGVATFVFGILYLCWKVVATILGGVAGLFVGRPKRGALPSRQSRLRGGSYVCPRSGCRKVETRSAAFCSQCGHFIE